MLGWALIVRHCRWYLVASIHELYRGVCNTLISQTHCAYLLTIHCQRDGLLSLCVVWGERFVGALCVVWGQRFKEITKLNVYCLLKIASDTNHVELNKYISVHRIMQLSSSFLTLCLAKQDDYIGNIIITFLINSVYPILPYPIPNTSCFILLI